MNENLREESQKLLEELRRLRDEIRVKVHLAGMDAKEGWQELKAQLESLEARIDQGVGQAGEQVPEEIRLKLHLALMDAKEQWAELEPRVQPLVEKLKEAGLAFSRAMDEGIPAAQAAVDELLREQQSSKERWTHFVERLKTEEGARRDKIREELKNAEASLEEAGQTFVSEMRKMVEKLTTRLS